MPLKKSRGRRDQITGVTLFTIANSALAPWEPLYFWMDQTGHEIDLIMEDGDALFAAEIKSGQTISPDMFDTLRWWSTHTGNPPETTTLVYGGDQTSTRTGIHVRPWTSV